MIKTDSPDALSKVSKYCKIAEENPDNTFQEDYEFLEQLAKPRNADPDAIKFMEKSSPQLTGSEALSILQQSLCVFWISPQTGATYKTALTKLYKKAQKCGAVWIEAEAAELYFRLDNSAEAFKKQAADFRKNTGSICLPDIIRRATKWERVLDAMINLKKEPSTVFEEAAESTSRMVWLFSFTD